ncbi:MAG: restriction endonuclease subunit S [Porphyromonas sp.]|nr:restriction endonuclease subunit S [Porphyromonas sp.]
MSYIDKLLQGQEVQWKILGEVFETRNGYTPSKSNSNFWEGGTIPWYRMEDLRLNGGILREARQYITPEAIKGKGLFQAGSIIMATTATIGEHALLTNPALANQQFTNFCLRENYVDALLPMFVYYYFFKIDEWCKANVNVSSFPSVDIVQLKKIAFPIPPLSVQEKIVEILDKFTTLEAELEAELDCRKRQYAYYRTHLLDFSDEMLKSTDWGNLVQWKSLGEVGTFVRGTGLQKKDLTDRGVSAIHYGQIYTHYGLYTSETKSCVSEDFAKKARKANIGDLVIATTSENDEDVCKAVAWLGKTPVVVSSDACFYRHSMNSKYVAYFFASEHFQKQKTKHITGTKVRRVNATDLAKILIPVPPMSVQEKIVKILDKFDILTNSITEGLPKEIELRRKQYEYYREQLLSFPGHKTTA